MNKEETKKAIAVMQAYVDGEEIEVASGSQGIPTGTLQPLSADPCWDWLNGIYIIKPEPRERWAIYDMSGNYFNSYPSKASAVEGSPTGYTIIRLVETR